VVLDPCEPLLIPLPFSQVPPRAERFTTVQFHEIMGTLLEQCRGLAAVCHTVRMYPDIVHPALTASLAILSEYLDSAHGVVQRWELDVHPGPTVEEEEPTNVSHTPPAHAPGDTTRDRRDQ